ncbi:NTF2 domain-containing protein [Aphis craccivora]|uniref:NTF2 domain-containing protein n=1 Tax=Aphis craccivora TaxID=307492 RepID=A0A6G0ZIV2_APHCR|nr:NTF2 domain-containing protein [Aphis craccivora]
MGNSVVRQTVFRGSWWTKECRRDGGEVVKVETIAQPPEERHEQCSMARGTWPRDGHKFGSCLTNVAAPETANHEDDDGDCRSLVVQSVVTVRCPSGQLLVLATTEMCTRSFVVEYTAPGSFAAVASVVMVKRDGVDPQT